MEQEKEPEPETAKGTAAEKEQEKEPETGAVQGTEPEIMVPAMPGMPAETVLPVGTEAETAVTETMTEKMPMARPMPEMAAV